MDNCCYKQTVQSVSTENLLMMWIICTSFLPLYDLVKRISISYTKSVSFRKRIFTVKKGFEIGPSAKESGASSSQMDVIALKQHALQKDTSQGPIPNRREALEQQARHREALEQQTRQGEELEQRAQQREMYRRVRNYEKRIGVSSAYLTHLAYAEIKVEEAENNINFFIKREIGNPFYGYDAEKENKDKFY